ncbi:MAG TPA: metabolite traffic protein EboE, partial [Roseiflexaceae bacterium]
NGFPYGPFHKQPVKAAVHAPDWREEERVQYTLRLIDILATLLPAGVSGGISTSPLTYRSWVDVEDASAWERFTHNLVRIAVALVDTRRQRDRLIHLDIEPEADGLLQNSFEVAAFFTRRLLPDGAPLLAEMAGLSLEDARQALLDHIRVCLDTCHMAVAYEDPSTVVDRLGAVGIQIGKVQISSALEVLLPLDAEEREALARALQPFADPIYLHQVGQLDHDGSFRQYPDLEDALQGIQDPRVAQWRIHFHTPIFVERYASFGSTQEQIRRTLELLRRQPFCQHLEIETYTWDVLPAGLKQDLFDSIRREYEWVLDVFP